MRRTQQAQDILPRMSNCHLLSLLCDQLPRDAMSMNPILPCFLESRALPLLEHVSDEPGGEVPAEVYEQYLSICWSTEGRVHQIRVGFGERIIEVIQSGKLIVECTWWEVPDAMSYGFVAECTEGAYPSQSWNGGGRYMPRRLIQR